MVVSAVRPAMPADVPMLARLHVAAWRETYPGLLPAAVIDRACDAGRRAVQWAAALDGGQTRIAVAPGIGFAQAGPQRDAALAAAGYPEELWALYVLRAGQGAGLGRALLRAVAGPVPFTALVIAGNARALAFYARSGARHLETRAVPIGGALVDEAVLAWDSPPRRD